MEIRKTPLKDKVTPIELAAPEIEKIQSRILDELIKQTALLVHIRGEVDGLADRLAGMEGDAGSTMRLAQLIYDSLPVAD